MDMLTLQLARQDWMNSAQRYWYVLRHYRKVQMARRAVKVARYWARCKTGGRTPPLFRPLPALRANGGFKRLLDRKLAGRRAHGSAAAAGDLIRGQYQWLHHTEHLPDPIDWRLVGRVDAAELWRFHLHYQEYLLDLVAEGIATEDDGYVRRAWELVRQWIHGNPLGDRRCLHDAWHPYCISRRLPVWVLLWLAAPPAGAAAQRMLRSILKQTWYLARHLERDLGGNHLLENARALVTVGAFLNGPDAEKWLRKGERIVRSELSEQILDHGEHFERSPMYHIQVVEILRDISDAVRDTNPKLADNCDAAAEKMVRFLTEIVHPDGDIPLLSDSALGEAIPPAKLFSTRHRVSADGSHRGGVSWTEASSPSGGQLVGDYWRYRDGDDFLLYDVGPVGADHLPAHAHCDLLSFEASLGGHRLFVDSGVYTYSDGPMRRYCRSTAAHNVLQIDGGEQCDVWSQFRMGYRGWPAGVQVGEAHGFDWARAEHNAYRRMGVGKVGRFIACRPGGPWICVDSAMGDGRHQLTNRLHLHPAAVVRRVDGSTIHIDFHGQPLRLELMHASELHITNDWYCPRFGCRELAPVVTWNQNVGLPAVTGWYLQWGCADGRARVIGSRSVNHSLLWSEGSQTSELPLYEL